MTKAEKLMVSMPTRSNLFMIMDSNCPSDFGMQNIRDCWICRETKNSKTEINNSECFHCWMSEYDPLAGNMNPPEDKDNEN